MTNNTYVILKDNTVLATIQAPHKSEVEAVLKGMRVDLNAVQIVETPVITLDNLRSNDGSYQHLQRQFKDVTTSNSQADLFR